MSWAIGQTDRRAKMKLRYDEAANRKPQHELSRKQKLQLTVVQQTNRSPQLKIRVLLHPVLYMQTKALV